MDKIEDTCVRTEVNPYSPSAQDFARAMRDLRYPIECNGGLLCWRILGAQAATSKALNRGACLGRCLGCNGKIR